MLSVQHKTSSTFESRATASSTGLSGQHKTGLVLLGWSPGRLLWLCVLVLHLGRLLVVLVVCLGRMFLLLLGRLARLRAIETVLGRRGEDVIIDPFACWNGNDTRRAEEA